MNLVRLIKLKMLNGELDNLTNEERVIISFFNQIKLVKHDFDDSNTMYTHYYRYENLNGNAVFILYAPCNKIFLSDLIYHAMYEIFRCDIVEVNAIASNFFEKVGLDGVKCII